MTEEEKASEYADKQEETIPPFSEEGGYCWNQIADAYLAGLHEGQPKWHDLRKDPNDLPKDNIPVLVIIDYLALGKEYAIRENLKDDYKGVIAWCEIPSYEGDKE